MELDPAATPGAMEGCGENGTLEQMIAGRGGLGFKRSMDLNVNCLALILPRGDAHSTCKCLACTLHVADAPLPARAR